MLDENTRLPPKFIYISYICSNTIFSIDHMIITTVPLETPQIPNTI